MNTSFIEHIVALKTDTQFETSLSRGRKANTTVGAGSFAFGSNVTASGDYSFASGYETTASYEEAHAEGYQTTASSYAAHAEGTLTSATGDSSHAEGIRTIANHTGQHVFGINNVVDTSNTDQGTYVEIVGNGNPNSDTPKSNARTLKWNGDEWIAGKLTVGAGPTDNMDVATKQYVDNFIKSGSMIFKGTIGSSGATVDSLPQIHEAGWMYLVSTAGTYLNKTCEVGDMIVCVRTSNGNLSTDWTIIQNNINPELYATKEYADAIKTNPSFTGNMAVSGKITIGSGPFDNTDAATKQYVDNTFTNNRAVLYKGTISSSSDLPSTHYRGWLYLVSTAGVYAGKTCEVGDMILCTQQGINLQSDSHWTVIQNNIDTTNMVTHSSNDLVANEQLAVFDGTSGKIIKGGLLGNNVADKSYVDTKFSSIVVPTLVAGDNISLRSGDNNSITISSNIPSTYATKNYVDTGIQNIDLSTYATKASPVFTGSITIGGTTITEAQLQALVAMANDDPIGTTWVFNDEITFPSDDLFIENTDGLFYYVNHDAAPYYSISIDKSSADSPKITYRDQFGDEAAYMFGVWNSNDYKTITFTGYIDTATPSIKAFMTWLRANATKAGDVTSATGVSF